MNTEMGNFGLDDADSRRPYEQFASLIRFLIDIEHYPAGDNLPSVPNLATEYEVAGATVQKGQQILKDEGLLDAMRGSGVKVRSTEPLVVSTAAYIQPTPGRYAYQIIRVAEVKPPRRVAIALGWNPSDGSPVPTAVMRHRLMTFEDKPVELSWSFYPADIARGTDLAVEAKIRGGAPRVLAEAGFPQREFIDRIAVRPPIPYERRLLDLPEQVSVLRQFRIIYSDDQRPVEVSLLVKDGHRYELEFRGSAQTDVR